MAQPTQVKFAVPSGSFVVIDNGAPLATSTGGSVGLNNTGAAVATGLNSDLAPLTFDGGTGANSQGLNAFGNGTIPDAVAPAAPGIPLIVQKRSSSSSGSVASLALAYSSNNSAGNSLIVVCGVGNGTAPTISDTQTNTYNSIVQIANGTAFNVAIFLVPNSKAGANTVTVNNGGSTASIAMEIYEVSGLVNEVFADVFTSAQGTATTTSPAVTATPSQVGNYVFTAFGLGTAAQTITVAAPLANDSGQLNPTTPAGLFSFVSASYLNGGSSAATSPSATVGVAEPWAVAVASFEAAPAGTNASGFYAINSPSLAPGTQVWFKSPA